MQVLGEDPGTKESEDAGFGYGMLVKDAGACVLKVGLPRDTEKCGICQVRVSQEGGQQ